MANTTITPGIIRALRTQFNGSFQSAFSDAPVYHDRLATVVPSSTRSNTYGWMAKIPKIREWIGERVVHRLAGRGFEIVNKDFELTVGVDRNDIEDENLGIYTPLMQQMGAEAKKHPDDLVFALITGGASAECFDGQFFFDTDHPVDLDDASKGVQSNALTLALNADNLMAARKAMMDFKGENGRPLGVRPTLLLVPTALEKTARDILAASALANGADNTIKGIVEYLVIPELGAAFGGSDTAWYLLDTSKPIKPFIFQTRQPHQFVQKTSVSDESVFWTKEYIWGTNARYNAGYGLWFLAIRGNA